LQPFAALGKIKSTGEGDPSLLQKVVRMRRFFGFFVFTLLLAQGSSFAQTNWVYNSDDPANGNLIPEPTLSDYAQANRAPGILSAPYDVVDQNGQAVSF